MFTKLRDQMKDDFFKHLRMRIAGNRQPRPRKHRQQRTDARSDQPERDQRRLLDRVSSPRMKEANEVEK